MGSLLARHCHWHCLKSSSVHRRLARFPRGGKPLASNNVHGCGSTLIELMIGIAIIGILSAFTLNISARWIAVHRLRSVAREAEAWIEEVRQNAAKLVSSDPDQGGCALTFEPGDAKNSQSTLISAGTDCGSTLALRATSLGLAPSQYQFDYRVDGINASGASGVRFTPRGSLVTPIVSNNAQDVVLRFYNDNAGLICVRIGAILGLVTTVEAPSANSVTSGCGFP